MDFTRIDFSQAWIRHSMFKTRLRAYLLSGTGDTDALSASDKCSLSEWLRAVAVKYTLGSSAVLEVSYLHEEVHSMAASLIRLYLQNKAEEARAGLARIEAMDKQLLEALNSLEKEASVSR